MTPPGRLSRALLLAAAVAAVGTVAATTTPGVAAPEPTTVATTSTTAPTTAPTTSAPATAAAAAAIAPQIEQAATVTKAARRLKQMGSLIFPMDPKPSCYILNNFGDPRSGGRTHEGVDTMASLGQAVYAAADGTLTRQALVDSPLSGNAWGLTATADKTYYFYAHLSAFADGLSVGSVVTKGQTIGYVGDTGDAGPGNYHLHFEVHPGGQKNAAIDPVPLLEIPNACTLYKR